MKILMNPLIYLSFKANDNHLKGHQLHVVEWKPLVGTDPLPFVAALWAQIAENGVMALSVVLNFTLSSFFFLTNWLIERKI